jgi:hypothetical protein
MLGAYGVVGDSGEALIAVRCAYARLVWFARHVTSRSRDAIAVYSGDAQRLLLQHPLAYLRTYEAKNNILTLGTTACDVMRMVTDRAIARAQTLAVTRSSCTGFTVRVASKSSRSCQTTSTSCSARRWQHCIRSTQNSLCRGCVVRALALPTVSDLMLASNVNERLRKN